MYYVSNDHIIIKLNSADSLCFNINGQALTQSPEVQYILNSNYKVMSKEHFIVEKVEAVELGLPRTRSMIAKN